MSDNSDILSLPAFELRRRLAKRELLPTELIRLSLEQLQKFNPALNAVVTLNERALDDAKELDNMPRETIESKRLYGLPVGIKDTTPVAGLRTTFGSRLYANHVPAEDALVVKRLRRAGAVIIGKTNTPEFAAGGNTFNEVFGPTRNPWNRKLSAGGSTGGGAAAVAANMISLAEGTDLGGSLRIPASFCGVVGLRPSPGLVPTDPTDYMWDSLSVTGPIARSAEDLGLFLQATAGPSTLSPLSQPLMDRNFLDASDAGVPKGTRVGYCKDIAQIGIDEAIENTCLHGALQMAQTGAVVEEIELDLSFAREAFRCLRAYWFVAHHLHHLNKLEKLTPIVSGNIKAGLKLTTEELGTAEQARGRVRRIFDDLFQTYEFLLTPCMAVSPFPVEQDYPGTVAGKKMETYVDWIAPTFVLSLTSLPVASVPCGLDPNGLPVGLQIVGRPFGEESVLAMAKQVQEAYPIDPPPLSELKLS
ncbi:amidase [bacterium]|nr:amidase [bacterium]